MEIITTIMAFIKTQDWVSVLGAITTLLGLIYAVSLIIPGDQPDKFIEGILKFTQKLSRKK